MELAPGGYFPKRVVSTPPSSWVSAPGVLEVCSVSDCLSRGPDGWIDHWLHNEIGFYPSPGVALQVIPTGAEGFRLFSYRLLPARYRDGAEEPWTWPDWDIEPPGPGYHSRGFDPVSRSSDENLGFECSPLSCNDLAGEIGVNRYCLIDSLERAVAVARRFSVEQPEPGPYYVVEVLERG
jgi:hypothetical protein